MKRTITVASINCRSMERDLAHFQVQQAQLTELVKPSTLNRPSICPIPSCVTVGLFKIVPVALGNA